jgi:hypothetical protein
MKPIQMKETNERESSRPMSSLYVDDADEDDDHTTSHYKDNSQSAQRQVHHQPDHSGPVSQDESDTTFNPD